MKTNEIQLGDYVKCSDKGIPMVVVGIYGDVAYLDFEGNESDMWEVDEEDIVPIPITPEILDKNGFKSITTGIWYSLIENYRVTLVSFNQHYVLSIDTTIERTNCVGNIEINLHYVHELQHILSFFNLDKEIRVMKEERVKLTPEILEKNGFTRIENAIYDIRGAYFLEYKIQEHILDINYRGINENGRIETRRWHGKINYIDEFQHAMEFCGIEKEIRL